MSGQDGNNNGGGDNNQNQNVNNNDGNNDGGGAGNQNQNQNKDGGSGGGNDSNQNNDGNSDVKLTDQQLQAAFQHPRFKELTEAKNKLKQLEDQKQKDKENKLKEDGKLQELVDSKSKEVEQLKNQLQTSTINQAVSNAAQKLGAHDTAAVTKLIDRDSIKINDDGTVEGVDEALKSLQQSSPYMFKTGSQQNIGSGSNPPGGNDGVKDYKFSDFNKPEYRDNPEVQKKMDKAMLEGRVDMDA